MKGMHMETLFPLTILAFVVAITFLTKKEWLGPLLWGIFLVIYSLYATTAGGLLLLTGFILLGHAAYLYKKKTL
jgi:hypothetical protein